MRCFRRILGDLAQILPQFKQLLRGKRVDIGRLDVGHHAEFLLISAYLGFFLFLFKNLLAPTQLPGGHNILLYEKALLSSTKRSPANLLTLIADRGIGV